MFASSGRRAVTVRGMAGHGPPEAAVGHRRLQHNSKALTQGVVPNFGLLVGTGAGSGAQDITELEISADPR